MKKFFRSLGQRPWLEGLQQSRSGHLFPNVNWRQIGNERQTRAAFHGHIRKQSYRNEALLAQLTTQANLIRVVLFVIILVYPARFCWLQGGLYCLRRTIKFSSGDHSYIREQLQFPSRGNCSHLALSGVVSSVWSVYKILKLKKVS